MWDPEQRKETSTAETNGRDQKRDAEEKDTPIESTKAKKSAPSQRSENISTVIQNKKKRVFFYGEYVFGNVPAYDILNLKGVEGADWKEDLDILFASKQPKVKRLFLLTFSASGDLRNVMKTVNLLPDTFQGQCNISINDVDIFVTYRSIVILLLILFYPDEASDLVLHVVSL